MIATAITPPAYELLFATWGRALAWSPSLSVLGAEFTNFPLVNQDQLILPPTAIPTILPQAWSVHNVSFVGTWSGPLGR
jgi:hypothetical protein